MGGTQQIGDPTFEYLFELELLAGSTLAKGGFITIYDLPDVTSPFTIQPNFFWARRRRCFSDRMHRAA